MMFFAQYNRVNDACPAIAMMKALLSSLPPISFLRSWAWLVPAVAWAIAMPGAPRANAAQLAGIDIPDSFQVDGRTLILNGYALRTLTILRVKIYVAALYLPQKMYDPKAIYASPGPKVVVVHYIHAASREQVQSRFREGEIENCGDGKCDPHLEDDFERLVHAAPAVQPGDTTDFVVTDTSLRVSFNRGPLQVFGTGALGNLILTGFIGPHAPSDDFRASLLGLLKP